MSSGTAAKHDGETNLVPPRDAFPVSHRMVYCFETLFDTQVEPETWARWLASMYVTHVEFHSYMPAHELIDTGGNSWNSYAGDPRLWTSRRAMQEKIDALHRYNIHAVLYASAYAASPAFYARYPDWAAYWPDQRPVFFPDIMPPYLVIQGMKRGAHAPHTIDGTLYNNYREYISNKVKEAVLHYNFDSVRMDFYGMPDTYTSPSFEGTSNMSDDLVDFIAELSATLKAAKPDLLVMVIELPNVDGDRIRQGVARDESVDVHWLELWPQDDATGPRYSDLIHEIRATWDMAPDAGVVASYYPQNPPYSDYPLMPNGWPTPNIQYNYATAFAAGSSWGGQSVAGHGSFTQVLPFKFAYMDMDRIRLLRDWNALMTAYGPYYVWNSPTYHFQQLTEPELSANNQAIKALLYERRSKRDDTAQLLALHLVNYGPNTDWAQNATAPDAVEGLAVRVPLEDGVQAHRIFALEPGKELLELTFAQDGALSFMLPWLDYYALVVIELTPHSTLPGPLPSVPELDAYAPEPYDTGGNMLWMDADRISLFDEEPLFAITSLDLSGSEIKFSDYSLSTKDAYTGAHSYCVTSGSVKFTATKHEAIRFNLNNFPHFSFAWKSAGASRISVSLEVVNMDTAEMAEIVYYAGEDSTGAGQALGIGPVPKKWECVQRDLLADVRSTEWGPGWHNVAAISLSLGSNGTAYFDSIEVHRTQEPVALHIQDVQTNGTARPLQEHGTLAEATFADSTEPQYLFIDLGSSQVVSRIELRFSSTDSPSFTIEAANDLLFTNNKAITSVASEIDSISKGWHSQSFPEPVNARYVCLLLTEGYVGVVEMRVVTR